MPKYYFDFHDSQGAATDEVGEELPSPGVARQMAFRALGDAARDLTLHGIEGGLAIEVRDDAGPILRVSVEIAETHIKK
jgi:hypothetical protein